MVSKKGEPGAQREARQRMRHEDWREKPRRPVEVRPSLLSRRGNSLVLIPPTRADTAVRPPSKDSDTPWEIKSVSQSVSQ